MRWTNSIMLLKESLHLLEVTTGTKESLVSDLAFDSLACLTRVLRKADNRIFFIGNGASASMASHISADLAKNALIDTQVFTDLSLLTAVANDLSYENVYAEPLSRRVKPKDMLVAISSSGESANILKATDVAVECKATVVTLSAMNPENTLRSRGDLNFYVPARTYGMAETSHNAILHHWVDIMTGDVTYSDNVELNYELV